MEKYIKVGDIVIKNIDKITSEIKVTKITNKKIVCGFWTFNKETLGEIDKDLGWDGIKKTGSYLCGKKLEEQ